MQAWGFGDLRPKLKTAVAKTAEVMTDLAIDGVKMTGRFIANNPRFSLGAAAAGYVGYKVYKNKDALVKGAKRVATVSSYIAALATGAYVGMTYGQAIKAVANGLYSAAVPVVNAVGQGATIAAKVMSQKLETANKLRSFQEAAIGAKVISGPNRVTAALSKEASQRAVQRAHTLVKNLRSNL